ncbi:MAG: hypothetical protein KDJ17_12600, partial [Hyphomicrobiaceae bacterium]|nr:hypothetical protein [Hyphomicrobiaceae bacterium]
SAPVQTNAKPHQPMQQGGPRPAPVNGPNFAGPGGMPVGAPPLPPSQSHAGAGFMPPMQHAPMGPQDIETALQNVYSPRSQSPRPPAPQGQTANHGHKSNEPWQPSEAVTIEEGFSPFQSHAGRPVAGGPANTQTSHDQSPPPVAQGFEPARPEEIRRSGRRMPTVEDLPEIGQREWHARQSGSGAASPTGEDQRKRGLLNRLTGMGKRPAAAPEQSHQTEVGDDDSLPVFFGRERR